MGCDHHSSTPACSQPAGAACAFLHLDMLVRALAVYLLLARTTAQKGIPSVCPYPVTWDMAKSTIIMPCNESGLTDPQSTVGWGIGAPAAATMSENPYDCSRCT